MSAMPRMTGRTVTILTVVDPVASANWYERTLGFDRSGQYPDATEDAVQVNLRQTEGPLELCLVRHPGSTDAKFDERRIGLDHLEFLVESSEGLEEWQSHLDALGVEHSGIKRPEWSESAILTFRDPDGIQLELYWSPSS